MHSRQNDAINGLSSTSLVKSFKSKPKVPIYRHINPKKMIPAGGTLLLKIGIVLLYLVGLTLGEYWNTENNHTHKDVFKRYASGLDQDQQHNTFNSNLPKNKIWKLLHFTDWSEWSVCNRHCTQNRIRKCLSKQKCGNTVIREERICDHEKKNWSRRCKFRQNRGLRKSEGLHIMQYHEEAEPRYGKKRRNNGFGDQTTSHYGKWSKWSPCTRSCTTQRHRWCRKPGICGRDVIRESAYCYVEGSFCQRWIHRKIRGSNKDDNDADSVLDEFELNASTIESLAVTKDDGIWKCGVVDNFHSKFSSLSYFTRIIGGRPAAPGNWPWQVAVLNRFREAFCGGTLVSPRWVLTAAHCIRKRLYIRIGEHDLTVKEDTELELRVDSIIIHPEYDVDTVDNDLALLRLPVTLTPSTSRGIACLPKPRQPLPTNQRCTIIGWGKSRPDNDFGTDILHEAEIPLVSSQICRDVYVGYRITENMFCAGDSRGRMDSCNGDSGGPLLCRDPRKPDHPWTIFGITSFGEGCGKPGKFGIYTRTTNYVRWIEKIINENETLS